MSNKSLIFARALLPLTIAASLIGCAKPALVSADSVAVVAPAVVSDAKVSVTPVSEIAMSNFDSSTAALVE